MLNLHSAGKERYLSASPLKPKTFSEYLQLAVVILMDVVIVIILTIVEIIKLPIYVLFKNGPKVIKGQNALVTGGANGIGRAIALELAKCGCNIIIADIDETASEKTLELLQSYDVKSIAYSADVSNPEDIKNLKQAIDESLGSVDILINNAGLMPLMSLREGSCLDVERIVDVNFIANIWTIRTFLPEMINKKRGHIVQISSMSALHPPPCEAIYTATKYAVTGMMLALEEELRQEGLADYVDFTTVHPYFVCTRRDLMNTLNLRFPAITAQRTAEDTVKGIICRKRRVVIPSENNIFTKILQSFPYKMQCLIRDYILREPQSRVIKNPYLYVA